MGILDDFLDIFRGTTIGPEADPDPTDLYGPSPTSQFGDYDGDGLDNDLETHGTGSNPKISDTDGDGLSDGEEFNLKTDPTDKDTDNDGLGDAEEVRTYHTDPRDQDSDHDGQGDYDDVTVLKPVLSTGPSPFGDPPAAAAAPATLQAADAPPEVVESVGVEGAANPIGTVVSNPLAAAGSATDGDLEFGDGQDNGSAPTQLDGPANGAGDGVGGASGANGASGSADVTTYESHVNVIDADESMFASSNEPAGYDDSHHTDSSFVEQDSTDLTETSAPEPGEEHVDFVY